jgi:co-chaperonin GroES (HSP10)
MSEADFREIRDVAPCSSSASFDRLSTLLADKPELRDFLRRFRPLNGVIVLMRDPVAEATKGGIIIPEMYRDDAKEKKHPLFGATVLKVGPGPWSKDGHRRIDTGIRAGDRLVIGRWGVVELQQIKVLGFPRVFTMNELDVIGWEVS